MCAVKSNLNGGIFIMREFWNPRGVLSLRNLTVMAMLLAIRVILDQFTVQLGAGIIVFRVTFIPMSMVAYLFGPWAALIFGILGDSLGFLTRGGGAYFPGFAISEAIICLIYALFTYRRPVDNLKNLIIRVTIARICIAIFVFFGLNFLWFRIMAELGLVPSFLAQPAAFFIASYRLVTNSVLLPMYIALSVMAIKLARRLEDSRVLHPRRKE